MLSEVFFSFYFLQYRRMFKVLVYCKGNQTDLMQHSYFSRKLCFLLLILTLFGAQHSSAQKFSSLVNADPLFIFEVDVTELKNNQLYLSMPFAKKLVLNPEQKKQLKERVVIKLELVYTKYRTAESFNQKNLNRNRLKELNKLAPNLFENRLIFSCFFQ